MSKEIKVLLKVRLPWWWRLYLAAAMFCQYTVGGIDLAKVAGFITAHTKYRSKVIKP
ncbi:hypothetical protein [Cohaesibacter celericrescens]|uniref:hypothetical protein n=1 Tax=Cohaesibacter celericrescens TaxID=2067669 RepID=UPI0015E13C1F|nr:hypothetical protein [Cohaesibacter celericrescens]